MVGGVEDLNLRPHGPQPYALPTAPHPGPFILRLRVMKTLKFDHDQAELIKAGEKTSTWRLYDDKDLSVDDQIKIIDKVNPTDSKSWNVIGQGRGQLR